VLGHKAAEESAEDLRQSLEGADMIFIAAGMGGGTGTGGAPVVADIAQESDALTVGVVTRPFAFEGTARARVADDGIQDLGERVDTLVVIPNDRLLNVADAKSTISEAFALADELGLDPVRHVPRHDGRSGTTVANPITFSRTPTSHRLAPPDLGADTAEVLERLRSPEELS